MEEITQEELKKMLIFASQKIEEKKEEINKINVFPVPDQDTGTNLAKTLQGVKEAIEGKNFQNIEEICQKALDGALTAAQGNAGVIFTGFLVGFLPALEKNPVNAKKLALAFEEGKKRAWKSILQPKEGTILDVISATAEALQKEVEKEKDIVKILEKAIEKAKIALLNTREKMEVLKKANVVDAGGLGFLMILESFLEAIAPKSKEKEKREKGSEEVKRFIQVLANRYEVVALILNPKIEEEAVKEKLKKIGDCLDIISIGEKMKIHIHTDYPEETIELLKEIGQIDDLRIEDMTKEVLKEPSVRKISLGLVVENTAFLLPKIVERYQIEIVETYFEKDGKKKEHLEKYQKAIKKQLEKFENVLFLTSSSRISKTFSLALKAKEFFSTGDQKKFFIFDTQQAISSYTLFVLRAIELIQEQKETEEILEKLKNLRKKTYFYVILKKPKPRQFIGKLNKIQTEWIKKTGKIGVYPLLGIKNGKLKIAGVTFAKDEAEAIFKKVKKIVNKKKIRAVIHHYQNFEQAKKLEKILKSREVEVSFISEIVANGDLVGKGSLMCGIQEI